MRHIPALGLAPGLTHAARLLVIGMNLHRKFLMREEKLQQQRKAPGIAGGVAHQFPLILLAELCQRLPGQRPVGHLAIVAGEPGLANLFLELAIGINRRQIVRAPRARIESRKHQEWI